jgi:hypothetical protein
MVLSVIAVGAAAITPAAAQTVEEADRSVETTQVQPGDTVNVTVDVVLREGSSFRIDEGFDPAFSNVEITDDGGASFDSAPDSGDRVVADYGKLGDDPRGSATLVYEVTIPDDATEGDSFTISSNQDSDVAVGTDRIEVVEEPPGVDVNGDGNLSKDLDGDGYHEDVDGDGEFSIADVQVLFSYLESDKVQNNADLFNFDGEEPADVTIGDVQVLFQML